MSLRDFTARVPYWKALGLAVVGGAALLWLQSTIATAIANDNIRDSEAYPARSEVVDRLARIEEKLDWLVRKSLDK